MAAWRPPPLSPVPDRYPPSGPHRPGDCYPNDGGTAARGAVAERGGSRARGGHGPRAGATAPPTRAWPRRSNAPPPCFDPCPPASPPTGLPVRMTQGDTHRQGRRGRCGKGAGVGGGARGRVVWPTQRESLPPATPALSWPPPLRRLEQRVFIYELYSRNPVSVVHPAHQVLGLFLTLSHHRSCVRESPSELVLAPFTANTPRTRLLILSARV